MFSASPLLEGRRNSTSKTHLVLYEKLLRVHRGSCLLQISHSARESVVGALECDWRIIFAIVAAQRSSDTGLVCRCDMYALGVGVVDFRPSIYQKHGGGLSRVLT